ncbi:glycoside hydrolase family 26 protein [Pseudorhodoferax sp. Leaf265]|uniref:glycoside hydrolase family 26 protein n=1 Tax=Pseudorhodoferax sp. Leaf265 TaxID=1736315 RepID=UPI00138EC9C3|nr:glycosyl hydrolase [Pseudorhodoferax sp. Leaf265]
MHEIDGGPPGMSRRRVLALPLVGALGAHGASNARGATMTRPPPSVSHARATLGTYQGPGCSGTARLEKLTGWLGRRPERHSDFLSQVSWLELVKAAHRGSRCWQAAGLPMSIGVPLLSREADVSLARGARGEYDHYFVQVAQAFVQYGLSNAVVRLGWELNQDWFPWRADRDPAAWVDFWRRVVVAMRSVDGAAFSFDWCTAWSRGKVPPDQVYPGDEFVDIVGMDIYNTSWNPTTPEQRWRLKMGAPFGLAWQRAFAAEHGKPVSFPEWGTGMRPDGRGGGDDPYFMERMTEWLATSDLAYHNYWDYKAPDFNARLSDGTKPEAEAVFLRFFGTT